MHKLCFCMFFGSLVIFVFRVINAEDATVELFLASRFDPVNDNETLDQFMAEHVVKTDLKTFGDLSIVTFNLAGNDDDAPSQAQAILELIDSTHPSVLGLQGCTQEVLDELLKTLVLFHYQVVNTDESSRDALTGEPTLVPVIYDSQLLSVKNNGYFRTNEKHKQVYASYVEFSDKRIERYYKTDVSFLVINADIFSTFNDVVSAMFFNILNDIAEAGLEKTDVFFLGNMGTVPADVKRVIELSYKNLLEADHNNKGLQRTTDHTKDNDDNIQRDFVLLKDVNDMFIVNYARILSKFPYLNKFPVQAIVTIKQKVKELAEEKNEEKRQEKQLVDGLIDKRVAEKSEQIASGEITEDEIKEEVREEVKKVAEAKEEASERKEEAKLDFEIQKAAEHTEKVKQEMIEQGYSKEQIQEMEAKYEESAEERKAASKKERRSESLSECVEEESQGSKQHRGSEDAEKESKSGGGDFYSLDNEDGEATFSENEYRSEANGYEDNSFDLEDGSRRYRGRSEDDSDDGAKVYKGFSRNEESEEGAQMSEEERAEDKEGLLSGEEQGNVEGNAEGAIEGKVEGAVEGNTEGKVEGSTSGSVEGSIEGGSSGSIEGNTEGSASGSAEGSTSGSVGGSASGSVEGNVGSTSSGSSEEKSERSSSSSAEGSSTSILGGSASGSSEGSSTSSSSGGSTSSSSGGSASGSSGESASGSSEGSSTSISGESTTGSLNLDKETATSEGGSSGVGGSKDHESISGGSLNEIGVEAGSRNGGENNSSISTNTKGSTESQTGTSGENAGQGSSSSSTSSEGENGDISKEATGSASPGQPTENNGSQHESTTNGGTNSNTQTTTENNNQGNPKDASDPTKFKAEVSVEPVKNDGKGPDDEVNVTTVVETGNKEPKKPEIQGPTIFDTKTGVVELEGGKTIRVDPWSRQEIHDKVDIDAYKAKNKREQEEKMKVMLMLNGTDPASIKDIHILDENQLRKPVQHPLIKTIIETEIENKKKELDEKNKILSERVAMKNKEAAVKKQEIILNSAKLIQKSVCDLKKARQPYEEYVRMQQMLKIPAPAQPSINAPQSIPVPPQIAPIPQSTPAPPQSIPTLPQITQPVVVPDQQKIAQAAEKIKNKIQCSNTILDVAKNVKQDCGCNLKQSIMNKAFSKKYPSENIKIIPANSPASKFNKVIHQPAPLKKCACNATEHSSINANVAIDQNKVSAGTTATNLVVNAVKPNLGTTQINAQNTINTNPKFANTSTNNIISQPTPYASASILKQSVIMPSIQPGPSITTNPQTHPITTKTIPFQNLKVTQPQIIAKKITPGFIQPKKLPASSTNQHCPCKASPQKQTIIHKTQINKEEMPDLRNKKTTHSKELMIKMVQKDFLDKFKEKHLVPGFTITTQTITNGPIIRQLKQKEAPILCQNMQIDKMSCEQADQLVKRAEDAYKEVVLDNFQDEINRAKECKSEKKEEVKKEEVKKEENKKVEKSEVKHEEKKEENKSESKSNVRVTRKKFRVPGGTITPEKPKEKQMTIDDILNKS